MVDTPTPTPEPVAAPTPAEVKPIAAQVEAIKTEVSTTPKEDQDKEWREKVGSTLDLVVERLEALQADKGNSPELTALNQTLSRLEARLAEPLPVTPPVTPPAPLPPSASGEGVSPTPVTPTETSSVPKVEKPKRVWL